MGKRRLTQAEAKVLQTILDIYHDTAEWPKFGALHRLLAKELDGELEDILRSLLEKLGAPTSYFEWSSMVQVPALGVLEDLRIEETYAVLLRGFPILREIYLSATEKPHVTHQDFLSRGWSQSDTRRLYDLLRYQPVFSGAGSTPEKQTWNMDLSPGIVRWSKAKSARELWQWRAEEERRQKKEARKSRRGRPDYSAPESTHGPRWLGHTLKWILGVASAVAAGIILWWFGFSR